MIKKPTPEPNAEPQLEQVELHIWRADQVIDAGDEIYDIGWYFSDETEQLHGPFSTIEETRTLLKQYCEELL